MVINYIGRKVKIKDSFKTLAEKKLKKLDKFFNDDVLADVEVTVEKKYQKVQITVVNQGFIFRTEKEAEEMEEALDVAAANLFKQIIKNKTKLESRGYKIKSLEPEATNLPEEEDFSIVKSKTFAMKPMNTEEAILQMNQLGHNFFVFLNDNTSAVNVVYKRRDGDYALLIPEML